MRFSVVTLGTEGDTRPLANLCRGLLDKGHELKLFASESTLAFPRALGVLCEPLQGEYRSIIPSVDPGDKVSLAQAGRVFAKNLKAFLADNLPAWLRAVGEDAARSDMLLFGSLALSAGAILHEELNKPTVRLAFQPLTSTREFCSTGLTSLQLPGWLNLWTYRLLEFQLQSLLAPSAERARLEVFGTKRALGPSGNFPTLYGISKELVARPADWPEDHIVCGHWSGATSDWQPPQDLLDFLGDERPIYVGFGSVSPYVSGAVLKALIGAIAGRRAVCSPGWGNIDGSVLPDNFFIARNVPHEWLFPRVSLAIHHGGAGTTHTVARAGVPQIILPVASDQFFWAARMAALGVAPRTSRRAATDVAALAKMITFAQLESIRKRARELSEAMAREDGVTTTVRELEALAERHVVPSSSERAARSRMGL